MWMLLTPREVELIMRPVGGGDNAAIVRTVQGLINVRTGDLELPNDLFALVTAASRDYRGGYEAALKAIVAAAERHS
jgi:hypothetical protein